MSLDEICPSHRALVVISDPGITRPGQFERPGLRYAFVTLEKNRDLVVADAAEFLSSSLGFEDDKDLQEQLLDGWDYHREPEDGVRFCGRVEIESLFRGTGWQFKR
jgi:hypothetical protein